MHVFLHALFLFFVLLNIFYFIYIVLHLISWAAIPISVLEDNHNAITKISVIIPARNEEATIANCLNAIATQTYPSHLLEIIAVDDHSADKTKETAEKALSQIKISSRVISNKEHEQGKKSAIMEAIRNSSGELLVITDADCQSGTEWLSTIESEYQKSRAYMLCGPVQIIGESNFLSLFQSLELCGLSLLSGAGIHAGFPLLCNGSNMAYTRKVFDDADGFQGINANPSGDDILLMFKIHKKYPGKIHYIKSKCAIVVTSAQPSLKDFLSQRIRWASKGLSSKNGFNSFVSMLVFGVNFLSLMAILFVIAYEKLAPLLIIGIGFKIAADFLLLLFGTAFFGKKKLLVIFPFAEIFTMLYITWVGIVANFASYTWKGRQYKHPL